MSKAKTKAKKKKLSHDHVAKSASNKNKYTNLIGKYCWSCKKNFNVNILDILFEESKFSLIYQNKPKSKWKKIQRNLSLSILFYIESQTAVIILFNLIVI